ncbi:ribosome-associated translation inhibitor RaiA [Patescibacteria group bacterium]|nr:ribosome-associated translation inhibitor RaiA [Patescibacteria group bacterium]
MKIIVRSKNITPSEAIGDFIEEKIGGLKKFIDLLRKDGKIGKPTVKVFVEIEKETRHHKKGPYFRAEAQVYLSGRTLRVEAKGEDLKTAIVEVKNEMQQEIKKYKLRKIDLEQRDARSIKNSKYPTSNN